jgi:hypothetical protein
LYYSGLFSSIFAALSETYLFIAAWLMRVTGRNKREGGKSMLAALYT